jgi:uncharacterized membrane protein YhaH (DUF805 family)
MIEYFKKVVFENYANIKGRARRSEYWYFFLATFILGIISSIIDSILGFKVEEVRFGAFQNSLQNGYISSLLNLLLLIPSITVSVRRLHDVGKSGWYLLLFFLPIIGWIWLLVLHCTDSDEGQNKYGPNPKGLGNDEIGEIGKFQE